MDHEKTIKKILETTGIEINGEKPWDIQVHNPRFYRKALAETDIGLGNSYMDKWWDCKRLDLFFEKIISARLEETVKNKKRIILGIISSKIINLQSKSLSKKVGEVHYDVGNKLYEIMLGKTMSYTCAYWKNLKRVPQNLDKAQKQKLDLVCRKLKLKPGMTVLDIGCGWGNFAKFAAEKYKVKVVGITISKEQVKLGKKLCKGLPVEIRFQDYRDVKEKFDRIVSLGMFEHVGRKNHRKFMKKVFNCLKDDGLFLLHTIGWKKTRKPSRGWISKYIFPYGDLPSVKQITCAAEGIFQLEDWHNFGFDYASTLLAWHNNFVKNWDKLKESYDERFYRMWAYYLLMCAGIFNSGSGRLWQIIFSKNREKIYESVR